MAHATLRITTEQRRARLGRRHFLAPGRAASDPVELTRGLVALHATDPATVHVSAAVRTGMQPVSVLEDALYEQRTLIRMLGMRRTLFIVPDDFAGIVQTSSTDAVAARHRNRLLKFLADAGAGGDDWLRKVEEATHDALLEMGHATGQQLSAAVPLLQTKLHLNIGKKYEAKTNITTQVLTLLAAEGHIVRGRPRGTWVSSQYEWWPVEAWLPGGIPRPPADDARVELVRAWLGRFGPATIADIKWWTGWTLGQARAAVAASRHGAGDLRRWLDWRRARGRHEGRASPGALGRAAARARPDGDGLDRARLVPTTRRPIQLVRHRGQRWTNDLV